MTLNLRNPQVEEIWLSALRAAGRKPATLSIYRYSVEQLLEWRQGDTDLTTVTRVEALAFVRHLTDTFKPSGVLCRVKALRAFYSWAVAEEMATTNPFTRITISVPEDPQPTASEDQIEAMLARAKRSARGPRLDHPARGLRRPQGRSGRAADGRRRYEQRHDHLHHVEEPPDARGPVPCGPSSAAP